MQLCKLTQGIERDPVYVNPEHVVAIQLLDGMTGVWTLASHQGGQSLILFVKETPTEAFDLLEQAAKR